MITVALAPGADLDGFRRAVRHLIATGARPEDVVWSTRPTLFGTDGESGAAAVNLPRALAELIRLVVCHRDPERYALLYAAVWRSLHGERHLLEISTDPLVHRLDRMAKAVRRDLHKMHAFVRFRRVDVEGVERYVAWFEPEHFILEATAGSSSTVSAPCTGRS